MKRTWFAIESEVEAPVEAPETIETELLEVPSETVEAVQAETAQVDIELETINEDLEEMEADDEAMARTEEAIDKSLEDEGEGLDETAVEIATEAMNSYTRRWGVKAPVVAKESFGNEESRREATLELKRQVGVAREGMAGRFADWVKAIIESFKNFIKGIFSKGQALQNRGAKYKKVLGSDKLKEATFEGDVEVKGAKGLVINDKVDVPAVINFLVTLDKVVHEVTEPWVAALAATDGAKAAEQLKAIDIKHAQLPGNVELVNEGGRAFANEKEVKETTATVKCLDRAEIGKAADAIIAAGKTMVSGEFKKLEKRAGDWTKAAQGDEDIPADLAKAIRSGMNSVVRLSQKLSKATENAAGGVDKAIVASLKKAGVKAEADAGDAKELPAPSAA